MYKVFRRDICNELLSRGYKLVCVEPNIKRPNGSVFLFEDDGNLHSVIVEIKNSLVK